MESLFLHKITFSKIHESKYYAILKHNQISKFNFLEYLNFVLLLQKHGLKKKRMYICLYEKLITLTTPS